LTLIHFSHAQIKKGNYTFTTGFRIDSKRNQEDIPLGIIGLEYAVNDHIGLKYTMLFSEELIHLSAGHILTALFLAYVDGYSFVIPEGIAVNIKVSDFLYVSPTVNLLGYEYFPSIKENNPSGFVGGAGIELKLFLGKHVAFKTLIEVQQQYNSSFGAKF